MNLSIKISAGILVYRQYNGQIEVLLAHNGGPYFKNKDDGFWTIPKGLVEENEDVLSAAKREFKEETSFEAPKGEYLALGAIQQKNNKIVHAWAIEADFDETKMKSNTFKMEWPAGSGQKILVPEIDTFAWFKPAVAKIKANQAQSELIDRLLNKLDLMQEETHNQTEIM